MSHESTMFNKITLKHHSGASAELCPYGAHVVSWKTPEGRERLFLSEKAKFERGAAIRGGVPIIFPQFNEFGPGPRHGFARNSVWAVTELADDLSSCKLTLQSSDSTLDAWPHKFLCEYQVTLNERSLLLELSVENQGDSAASFTSALHTYFRIDDFQACRVSGLRGLKFWDNDGSAFAERKAQVEDSLSFNGPIDRVYFNCQNTLKLMGGESELSISGDGFEDVVIWNPGLEAAKTMSDMVDQEYRNMLCVEAARIDRPVTLASGERWLGAQCLSIVPGGGDD